MKIYDISMSVCHEMAVYKNKPAKRPQLTVESDFASADVYETKLTSNLHTGTHLDMPLHIFPGGETVEALDLNKVFTRCRVLDLTDLTEKITAADLADRQIAAGEFILLKTRNSTQEILQGDFIYLDQSGAAYLQSRKITGVGIDSLGIERSQPGHETHKILLGAGIVILEGLRLTDIAEDEYQLVALPIKISGAEAAPVRAVLIK